MHVEHVPRCTYCTGPAKQNGSAPVPENRMSVAANSVLLTISDSIFKVFTVKKQIRMCNYNYILWKLFRYRLYIFNIDKKSTLAEKVDMAIFFQ